MARQCLQSLWRTSEFIDRRELHFTMESAITREKALRKWNRSWKLKLIEESNPEWLDLNPLFSMPSNVKKIEGALAPLDFRLRGNDEG